MQALQKVYVHNAHHSQGLGTNHGTIQGAGHATNSGASKRSHGTIGTQLPVRAGQKKATSMERAGTDLGHFGTMQSLTRQRNNHLGHGTGGAEARKSNQQFNRSERKKSMI